MIDTSTFRGRVHWHLAWLGFDLWGRRKHKPIVYRYAGYGMVWESTLANPKDKRIIYDGRKEE